ncbi:MAG TPA: TonB-dependent receptor, partial [Woeseiaceae bacterium]|nr:TonB-dependent receptor [Woeseiaceae bacterium]
MDTIGRNLLKLSASLLGISLAAGSVNAQDEAEQGTLDEIIVTSEFREASLQETPIAITAITGDMLDIRGQTNLYEVANQSPNVTLKRGGQARSGMIAFIRGVGQYDFIAAVEPGVGVYVDDVYYAQLTGSLLELLDVDRVEVLRGPQGTLAGRNSIGGAVKMYTKQPGEDHGGYLRVGFGNYEQVDFRGAGDMTLIEDKLYARVSGAGKSRDGYVKVLDYGCTHPGSGVPAQRFGKGCEIGRQGELQYATGRLQLRWIANDDIEIGFDADYLDDKSGMAPGVATYADRTAIEANPANATITLVNPADGTVTYYRGHNYVPYGPYHNSGDPINDPYVTYATVSDFGDMYMLPGDPAVTRPVSWKPSVIEPRNYITQWGTALTFDWNISDTMSFHSISSYREYDVRSTWDEDASPVALNQLDNRLDNWQFTQEFRLNGALGDNLDYTVGAFYLDQNSHYEARVTLNYAMIDFIHGPDPTPADTKAAFAHLAWHLTDNLTVSGGVRYSEEYKGYTHHRHNPDGTDIPPGPPGVNTNWRLAGIEGLTAEFEDERTDWRLAASFDLTDNSMVYGSASTGYKGGGVNPRPFFPDQLKTFDSEELTSYELGWKSDLFDNTLRLNVAGFFTEYDNIQLVLKQCEVPVFVDPDLIGPPCLKPANVGDAEIKGVEVEATWYLTDDFLVDVSASTLDFEYVTVDPLAFSSIEIAPLDMITPYTPEDKWSLGAQYTFPETGLGNFLIRVDGSYMSDIYTDPANRSVNQIDGYT